MKSRWKSIQSRLFLLLLLVLVPVVAIQAYMFYTLFQERKAAALQANLELARGVVKTFERFVQGVLQQELSIGLALTSHQKLSPEAQNRILLRSHADNPGIWEIFWANPSGVVLAATGPQFLGMRLGDRDYFRKIVAGQDYVISDLLLSRATGKPSFTISRGIRDEQRVLLGIVVAGILPERLDKELGVKRILGGGFALADTKGMMVYRYPAFEVTWEERNWFKQYPQFAEVLKGKEVEAAVYGAIEGKNRLVAFTPVPFIGWAATAGQREEDVTGPIWAAISRSAILFGSVLLTAFLLAIVFSRKISNPVEALRRHALAVGRGEEKEQAPVQSISEFKDLAAAFNVMAENVRMRETLLRESDQRFRLALRNAPVSVAAQDRDFRYIWAYNQRTARPEQIIGHTDAEIFTPEEVARIAPLKRRVLDEGVELREQMWFNRPAGRTFLDVCWEPIRDEAGRITGVASATVDLTPIKQAEETLQQGRRDLDRAQEVGQIGSWRLDVCKNVLTWSDENYRIFGVPKGRPMNYEAFLEIVHPEDRQDVDRKWQAALGGEPYDIEHRLVVGQQVKWVREKAYLEFDGGGNMLGGFGITQDITDRKRAEAALRASEERYRSLFEGMTEGFGLHEIICDEKGVPCDYRFLEVNPAFERITGLKRENIIHKTVNQILPNEDPRWVKIYGEVALAGKAVHFENYSPVLKKHYEVFAYSPAPRQFGVLFMDITERKQAEEREGKELKETSFANRILALFVVHDGDELFNRVLAVVQETMASKHGVFGYIAEPGHLFCPSLSKMLDECEIEGKCIHYPPEKWKGLWARALTNKRSFYTNEAPPVPPGHPIIHNNLAVPILFRGEAIGLLNLANKEGGYNEEDRKMVDALAARMAPVLYAWIQRKLRDDERKQAEEALRKAKDELEVRVQERTEELVKSQQRLQQLASQLLLAQEKERKRVAVELHDGLLSELAATKFLLEGKVMLLDKGKPVTPEELRKVANILGGTMKEARRLMNNLHPSILNELGLIATIGWLCKEYLKTYPHISIQKQISVSEEDISRELKIVIYRVLQESLNNFARHGNGDRVDLSLINSDGTLALMIRDYGQGFDLRKVERGVGLDSMRERIELSGGEFQIESAIGQGTTIRAIWKSS